MTKSSKLLIIHYYNGASRIASRVGGGFSSHPDLTYDPLNDHIPLPSGLAYEEKSQTLSTPWTRNADCAGLNEQMEFSYSMDVAYQFTNPGPDGERNFYHSNHTSAVLSTGLGSSAFITSEMRSIREDRLKISTTEQNGYATQFLAYLPYGETLAEEQNSTSYYSPFKFSAKEKDIETGYSYFGARYYSPELSIWLGVDPMSDKYPSLSPYNYCAWNPVMLVDPDGREIVEPKTEEGRALWKEFKNLVDSRVKAYDARTSELRSQGKTWRADRRERNRGSNPFVQTQNELIELEQSKNIYHINFSDLGANKGGSLSYAGDGSVNVNINASKHGDYSVIQRMAHEFKHAYQFEIGELDLHRGGFGGMLYDKTDELAAYNRGNFFYGLGSYGKGTYKSSVWESFFNGSSPYYHLSPANRSVLNTGLSGDAQATWLNTVKNTGGLYIISERAKQSVR